MPRWARCRLGVPLYQGPKCLPTCLTITRLPLTKKTFTYMSKVLITVEKNSHAPVFKLTCKVIWSRLENQRLRIPGPPRRLPTGSGPSGLKTASVFLSKNSFGSLGSGLNNRYPRILCSHMADFTQIMIQLLLSFRAHNWGSDWAVHGKEPVRLLNSASAQWLKQDAVCTSASIECVRKVRLRSSCLFHQLWDMKHSVRFAWALTNQPRS